MLLNIQDIAMKKLTEQEELIMTSLWNLEKAFVKDIVANITQSLHYNTVSTVVRKLENKGFISHESFGNTHRYFPSDKQRTVQRICYGTRI